MTAFVSDGEEERRNKEVINISRWEIASKL